MFRRVVLLASAALLMLVAPLSADIITKWTFDGATKSPSTGTGTASVTPLDPALNETFPSDYAGSQSWSILPLEYVTGVVSPTNPLPKTRFFEFLVSTAGYQDIAVTWGQRNSSTAVNTGMLQYTLDGSNWLDFQSFEINESGSYLVAQSFDLSAVEAADNNASFGIRIAADIDQEFGNYKATTSEAAAAVGGTWRVNDVTIIGTPLGASGPIATITGPDKDTTILGPVSWQVTFDVPVSGFDSAADVLVNEGGTANAFTVEVTGPPAPSTGPYTVTLSEIGGEGTLGITVKAGAATGGGQGNLESLPSSPTTVVSTPRAFLSSPSTYFTNSGPVVFEVNFNMPVTGFDDGASDFLVTPTGTAAIGSVAIEGTDGTTGPYAVTLSDITGNGTFVIAVAANAAIAEETGNSQSFDSSVVTAVEPVGLAGFWSFNSDPPDGDVTTGTVAPEIGAGTALLGGGVGEAAPPFATGFPNSGATNDNSGWNTVPFAGVVEPITNTNPLPKTRYIEFTASTVGFEGIVLSFNKRFSDSAVDTATVQYTVDGVNWIDFVSYTASRGASWEHYVFDFSGIAAVDNNPAFAVRLAADLNPSTLAYDKASQLAGDSLGTGGTWRFDFVRISGTPTGGSPVSIAEAKGLADGTSVTVSEKVLYLKENAFGYIEDISRATGIRVEGNLGAVTEGDSVNIVGTMQTTAGGERYIQIASISGASGPELAPFVAGNKALKTDTIIEGLYVRAFGTVKEGSIGPNSYVITDGFDEDGVPVITSSTPEVTGGEFVDITGALGYDFGRVIYQK